MKKDVGSLIFSLVFLLVGVFLLAHSLVVLVRSKRWSVVTGSITGSRIDEGRDSETNSPVYTIKISLAYNPGGIETYNHNPSSAVYQSSNLSEASAKLSDYPVGGSIAVWCNPNNPQKCMIESDIRGSKGALVGGLIFAGLGVVSAWLS
jgi:hypothetical protein